MSGGAGAGAVVARGRCNCGAVAFEVRGPLAPGHACHCGLCRRQGGNWAACTEADRDDVVLTEAGGLRWHASSNWARRGFCGVCGAALFWEMPGSGRLGLNLGSLSPGHGVRIERHIHVADKGDWYEIDDGLPQFADHETPMP
ncbi:MAG: GFA family protein [Pseudomonadota bacterium]